MFTVEECRLLRSLHRLKILVTFNTCAMSQATCWQLGVYSIAHVAEARSWYSGLVRVILYCITLEELSVKGTDSSIGSRKVNVQQLRQKILRDNFNIIK